MNNEDPPDTAGNGAPDGAADGSVDGAAEQTPEKSEEFEPGAFARPDEMPDEMFYSMPRLVKHIDDPACDALSDYYGTLLTSGARVLDLMSSCVSHLPSSIAFGGVTGQGMNRTELEANPQLTDHFIQNLNKTPLLPLDTGCFDACFIAVSIQYLTQPVAVIAEIGRVLKPDGVLAVSFSNRMFPTKAVAAWRRRDDAGHLRLVTEYIERAGGFGDIRQLDRSPGMPASDPLFIVEARRRSIS